MRKRILHGARDRDVFLPMPYMSKQPTICATPFMVIQKLMWENWVSNMSTYPMAIQRVFKTYAVRLACSSFLYQTLVMVMKAGETAPSAKPSMNLTAAKPAKLVGAAKHMQTMPQITLYS